MPPHKGQTPLSSSFPTASSFYYLFLCPCPLIAIYGSCVRSPETWTGDAVSPFPYACPLSLNTASTAHPGPFPWTTAVAAPVPVYWTWTRRHCAHPPPACVSHLTLHWRHLSATAAAGPCAPPPQWAPLQRRSLSTDPSWHSLRCPAVCPASADALWTRGSPESRAPYPWDH